MVRQPEEPVDTTIDAELAEQTKEAKCRESAKVFLVGQVIAFLVGCTGLFSQLLAANAVDIPTVQSALNYFVLSFALIVHAARSGWKFRLHSPWWAYLIVAFFDLEGNYAVTKAYQCTDITSIMLLDCMTIPTCFMLSKIFLKAQFHNLHYGGMCLCLVGIALIIVSDTAFQQPDSGGSTNQSVAFNLQETTLPGINGTTAVPLPPFCLDSRAVGDALCLTGSVLYAVSNVAQESIVKYQPIPEFLGMLGVFGFLLSVIQIVLLESQELATMDWVQLDNMLYLIGFGASLSAMYILTSIFLRMADSTFFNISLLFSDFWAVVVSFVLFHELPQWLYFVAAPLVIAGCVVYSLKKVLFPPPATYHTISNPQSQHDAEVLKEPVADDGSASQSPASYDSLQAE